MRYPSLSQLALKWLRSKCVLAREEVEGLERRLTEALRELSEYKESLGGGK